MSATPVAARQARARRYLQRRTGYQEGVSDVVLLLAGGFALGFVLSFLFGDTSHAVLKLLALGVVPASAVGWYLGRDADLEGVARVSVIVVLAGIFFAGYALATLAALAARRRRGRPTPLQG
jgi:hypothetical protein